MMERNGGKVERSVLGNNSDSPLVKLFRQHGVKRGEALVIKTDPTTGVETYSVRKLQDSDEWWDERLEPITQNDVDAIVEKGKAKFVQIFMSPPTATTPVTCPNCGAEISPTLAAQVISAQRKTHSGGRRPLKTGPVSRVTEWRRRKKAEDKKSQPRK